MPTWVVPSIAAELWRTSVDDVLARMHDGALPSRRDNGFTFVDIDPSPQPAVAPPPTFRELTADELQALHPELCEHAAEIEENVVAVTGTVAAPGCSWEGVHWRDARKQVQRTRRGPACR